MSTYIPIQTITLSSAAASVTFTGIPQTHTDLVLVANLSANTGSDDLTPTIRVGNASIDTGSNYSQTTAGFFAGAGVISFRDSNDTKMRFGRTNVSGTEPIGNSIIHFQNYSNSTTNKTVLARTNSVDRSVMMGVGLWRSTSAINTIQVFEYGGGLISPNSTFTLYGIAAGTTKAIGGEIYVSGGYAYHTFRQSAQFIPTEDLTADVLVIAGGGSGGGDRGGGGGAGGYRYLTSQSLSATNYNVIVGAGGAGAITSVGSKGSNSSISTISSSGGGSGWVGTPTGANANGGSGGGGWGASAAADNEGGTGNIGSYSPSEGNNGGAGEEGGARRGGGGGGAGAAGASGTVSGNGGAGKNSESVFATATLTGVSGYYAGGGGGGTLSGTTSGGAGGGGGGVATGSGNNASANTGSGGGGAGDSGTNRVGGNGGSGIVIVRYLI